MIVLHTISRSKSFTPLVNSCIDNVLVNIASELNQSLYRFIIAVDAYLHVRPYLIHHSLLAPTWTAFSDYTGLDLLCSTVFHF